MGRIFVAFLCVLGFTDFLNAQAQTQQNLLRSRGLHKEDKDIREKTDYRLPRNTPKLNFRDQEVELFTKREKQLQTDFKTQALETPINPEEYYVGPGDQFTVSIWSSLETSIPAQITPEGRLVIPTIGSLNVNGMTLREAQALVMQAASKKYINAEISTDLTTVRGIRVHVTGQVRKPGVYSILAVKRVADLIQLAGGLSSWAYERGIVIRHHDGSSDEIDFFRYEKLGDLSANSYLRGGDVIYVPPINLHKPTVRVEGAVNDPGIYQIENNETLTSLLMRVEAFSRRTDLRYAYVERKRQQDDTIERLPVFQYVDAAGNGGADLTLHSGDVVNIPQRREDVYVVGAVRAPGAYPYIPGWKIQDYVGVAGSMYQAVNIRNVKIVDPISKKQKKGDDTPIEAGTLVWVPAKTQFGVREGLQSASVLASLAIAFATLRREF